MNERNDGKLREALKRAIPPASRPELERDLWSQMLRRLDERPRRVGWLDWAVAAVAAACCALFPEVIPAVLYHL